MDATVAGEPVDLLIQALPKFTWQMDPDGMMRFRFRLEPTLGQPFLRALMRVEAELLLEDADALGTDAEEHRTPEQRGADALVELARRVANACCA